MSDIQKLHTTALSLVQKGKGILAADQSPGTIGKQLAAINASQDAETRRKYRQLLFSTKGIEQYVTGVILHDGTIRNTNDDGVQFSDVLIAKGIIPIIKVDKGTVPYTNFPDEVLTQGLDDLQERLKEYFNMGARAAKWRAVITIGKHTPTPENIAANAFILSRYAAMCQEEGLVPIVEPEVIYAGDHTLERAEQVTTATLKAVFAALERQRVDLSGVILKSSMVLAGKESAQQSTPQEVAEATIRTFKASVPEDVPGVVFLSGGQTPRQATENLDAIAELEQKKGNLPWEFAFSFSRGIEQPVQEAWAGKDENVAIAQKALLERLRLNGLADIGAYESSME